MAASMALKVASILVASCIIALAYLYDPVPSTGIAYVYAVRAAAGIFVISGSVLLSAAIGRTFLKNGGREAFKVLYFASISSTGAGVAVLASVILPMNVNAALFALSSMFALAGVSTFHFFQSGDA
jgi:hypothetical protein